MFPNKNQNTLKRFVSLILSVIMIFSIVPTAFAAESFDRDMIPYEELIREGYDKEEIDKVADIMENYAKNNSDDSNETSEKNTEIVATLSVVTRVKGTGHAWIYVENLTDEELQVGHYMLPVGEGVSVGLFSFTCDDGIGIYYNVESYCCNVHGGDGLVSLTTELNENEMNTLNEELLDYPNRWGVFFNCMYFAFSMWNSVSDQKLVALVLPILGQLQLRIHGGKRNNLDMFCPRADQVLRLIGEKGDEQTLVPVSSGSIDQQIGG